MSIDKKRGRSLLGIVVGLACAAAVGAWPSHAVPIQMGLYTMLVFVPLTLGTWRDRHHTRFWTWVSSTIILHCAVLYLIRPIFPVGTIFAIIPLALIEIVAVFMLMLKLTGQDDAEPE
jgi:hypothetical protein